MGMIHYAIMCVLALGMLGAVVPLIWSVKGRRGVVLAVRSLWLHKLRSVLSVLGIIIGNLAVITLMAFGEGSMQDALADIARQGATNVIIRSVKPPDDSSTQRRTRVAIYGLTYADYDRFRTLSTIIKDVPMRFFPQEVRYLERMHTGRVVATTATYADINDVQMAAGRFLDDDDDYHMLNVAVLGAAVADRLFPFEDPLLQYVRLGNHFYRVIGVIESRMPLSAVGGSSQSSEDFNNDVYIPLRTCQVRFGERIIIRTSGSQSGEQVQLSQVTLTLKDMESVRPAGSVVRELLERFHTKNDFAVTVPLDRLEAAERERDRFTRLLVLIASISLLVGGIGIMNIMLATVTERTREIGIRRALGAKQRDIVLQFLIEATMQTAVGGLVGVMLGLGVVLVVPWLAHVGWDAHLPAQVNVPSIFYSLAVAVIVGIAFGLYPAWRASRLDPIEALRHE
jgi:putative ABC transport system permease protein